MNDTQIITVISPIQKDVNDCIFCLEKITENDTSIDYQKGEKITIEETIFRINCNCKPGMHKKCIGEWLVENQKCPICLINIDKIEAIYPQICEAVNSIMITLRCICCILVLITIIIAFIIFI